MRSYCRICRGVRECSAGGVCTSCGSFVSESEPTFEEKVSVACTHCTGRAFERRDGKVVCSSCGYEYVPGTLRPAEPAHPVLFRLRWSSGMFRYSTFVRVFRGVITDAPRTIDRFIGKSLRAATTELRGEAQPVEIRSLLDVVPDEEEVAPTGEDE